MRYTYATYRTREKAEDALEDMFAAGEVSEGEFPRIDYHNGKTASWSKAKPRYEITLDDHQ